MASTPSPHSYPNTLVIFWHRMLWALFLRVCLCEFVCFPSGCRLQGSLFGSPWSHRALNGARQSPAVWVSQAHTPSVLCVWSCVVSQGAAGALTLRMGHSVNDSLSLGFLIISPVHASSSCKCSAFDLEYSSDPGHQNRGRGSASCPSVANKYRCTSHSPSPQ